MIAKAKVRAAAGWVAMAGAGMSARAEAQQQTTPVCGSNVATGLVANADGGAPRSPLYVAGPTDAQGSNGAQALMLSFARVLGPLFPIVYVGVPSCIALQDVVSGSAGGVDANYLTSTGTLILCTASRVIPDVAISDVYPDTCAPGLLTAGQGDVLGPVDVAAFVVPSASTEQSISADAAYVVFGFGASQYAVMPWTDPASIFAPSVTSGPLNLVGATIGLAANKWADPLASRMALAVEAKAVAGGKANPSIGILPVQTAEATAGLRILAYQHTGQSCGFFPDSDAVHNDRINVRQGRYGLWGPLHFVTNVDARGNPLDHTGQPDATLSAVVDLLETTGLAPMGLTDGSAAPTDGAKTALMLAETAAGLVPWCAMQVIRDGEAGAEASYAPSEPCGCAFESSLGTQLQTTRCATCVTDSDCVVATPHCSYGYCEVQ